MNKLCILFFFSLSLNISCNMVNENPPELKQLFIRHFKSQIPGSYEKFYMFSSTHQRGIWQVDSLPIHGFDYEWGYTFLITIEEYYQQDLFTQKRLVDRKFKDIIYKTRIDDSATFPISVYNKSIFKLNDTLYALLDEINVVAHNTTLLDSLISRGDSIWLSIVVRYKASNCLVYDTIYAPSAMSGSVLVR